MSNAELLTLMDDILGEPEGTLDGSELLTEMPGWDSLAMISVIALMHERFGIRVTGKQLLGFERVDDMIVFVSEKATT